MKCLSEFPLFLALLGSTSPLLVLQASFWGVSVGAWKVWVGMSPEGTLLLWLQLWFPGQDVLQKSLLGAACALYQWQGRAGGSRMGGLAHSWAFKLSCHLLGRQRPTMVCSRVVM